ALVNLLRQLRAGFTDRSTRKFPDSIALIGMRDLRDYLTRAKDGIPVNPGSPFNIKSASLTLRNFTEAEVASLYQQHTDATGQVFEAAAIERAFYWTSGQPFLVNALARIVVMELAPHGETVTADHIQEAKLRLILARTTHIDSLSERLKEERIARIIKPILLGEPAFHVDLSSDDMQYCVDLGLLRQKPKIEAANPIYREVLVRLLTLSRQPDLPEREWLRYGKLDVVALVDSFFVWWRRHADALRRRDDTPYREAVPQIVFMAWVQKVVNGGGEVGREFALGRGRIDVVIHFAGEIHAFELKRVTEHDSLETIREEGIEQAVGYLDRLGTSEGWLLIFDERPLSWEQKLWREEVEV
ncbi:MAG TPA: PD-(D/E)XK nuclease domain-containing protein, partial [Myxococcota bacterium]|nr:PD-(D/E)XK nuclease domain-containing protein [Myxococcota bacterium]